MANWQRTIDISETWQMSPEVPDTAFLRSLSLEIANKLKGMVMFAHPHTHVNERRDDLVDTFESMANDDTLSVDEFDYSMGELYDWADMKLDDHWNGKKVAWIKTNF